MIGLDRLDFWRWLCFDRVGLIGLRSHQLVPLTLMHAQCCGDVIGPMSRTFFGHRHISMMRPPTAQSRQNFPTSQALNSPSRFHPTTTPTPYKGRWGWGRCRLVASPHVSHFSHPTFQGGNHARINGITDHQEGFGSTFVGSAMLDLQ